MALREPQAILCLDDKVAKKKKPIDLCCRGEIGLGSIDPGLSQKLILFAPHSHHFQPWTRPKAKGSPHPLFRDRQAGASEHAETEQLLLLFPSVVKSGQSRAQRREMNRPQHLLLYTLSLSLVVLFLTILAEKSLQSGLRDWVKDASAPTSCFHLRPTRSRLWTLPGRSERQ